MPPRTPAQPRRRATTRLDGHPVRVTRRRLETRQRLLAAAGEVFATQGYGATSIEDVCDRAGYTRGAFYSNFDSLADVLVALHDQQAAHVIDEIQRAVDDLTGVADVAGFVGRIVPALRLDREWLQLRLELVVHATRDPQVAHQLAVQRQAVTGAIAAPLEEIGRRLGLGPAPDHIESCIQALMLLYDGICLQVLADGDDPGGRHRLTELGLALFLRPQS